MQETQYVSLSSQMHLITDDRNVSLPNGDCAFHNIAWPQIGLAVLTCTEHDSSSEYRQGSTQYPELSRARVNNMYDMQ